MKPNPAIRSIYMENVLSFGPSGMGLELQPLNLLVGPNASGKSNLIEVLGLLRAAPRDLPSPIRKGGGVSEWLWKGERECPVARTVVIVENPVMGRLPLRHTLEFTRREQTFDIVAERLENDGAYPGEPMPYVFFDVQYGHGVLNVRSVGKPDEEEGTHEPVKRQLQPEELEPGQSVLAQRKDPEQYPEITFLGGLWSRYRFYREWNLGRYAPPRLPQSPDLPQDFLTEDATNLGLVLNDLQHRGIKEPIVRHLKRFCGDIEDVTTYVHGGTVQIFVHEKGVGAIPATRLSDGTLRYLCLLAILCHPEPPPLICIEEPELGLHPDVIPVVAELLVEASARTQLIVTTHSDVLVDAFSDRPETVVICDRTSGGTTMQRLDGKRLADWLKDYRLGRLWRKGELGGVRY